MKVSIKNKPHIICRVVDGEALILDSRTGYYYSLDPIGTSIWLALNEGQSKTQIIEDLAKRYAVDIDQIRQDVTDLVADLYAEQLWEMAE